MIILNVFYTAAEGKRDAFLEKIDELSVATLSRAEAGCSMYDYFLARDNETDILLVEHWADVAALAKHSAAAHFKALQEIKAEYIADVKIEKYVV